MLPFIDYVLGTLIRHGVTQQFDLEDALQRIVFLDAQPGWRRGGPKKITFRFRRETPYDLKIGNPLQAIFRQYLTNAVRTVADRQDSRPCDESSIPTGCPLTTADQATIRPTAPSPPKRFLVVFPATITKC